MIDLDRLAEQRAKTLNQKEDLWRRAVWSADFQKLSQSMSDGEVEEFLSLCPTVKHFEAVVRFLNGRSDSPFTLISEEAKRAGLSLEQWIAKLDSAK